MFCSILAHFCPNLVAVATPLALWKFWITFEIADPENPAIHAKFVSIYCTEMKLCLFVCLAYLYHCGYRQFSRFLQKIVEIVKKVLIKPIKGTRIHGNTSYEPLTTFLRRTMQSRQNVLFNFFSFLPKFGCRGNSLSSLEIFDNIYEIADPENLTIHAKFVSISWRNEVMPI